MSESDLPLTLETMIRYCQARQAPDNLIAVLESLRIKHDLAAVAAVGERNTAAAVVAAVGGNQAASAGAAVSASLVAAAAAQSAAAAAAAAVASSSAVQLPNTAAVAANQQPNAINNNNSSSSVHFHSGVNQARDFNDPQGLQEKTEVLLREWITLYHSPSAGHGSNQAFTHFVKQMNMHGILKTDELITRFFRNCVSYCREICIRSMNEQQQQQGSTAGGSQIPTTSVSAVNISQFRNKCFQHVDPFVRLVALLIKHSGETSNPSTKINLLNKVSKLNIYFNRLPLNVNLS